MSWGYDSNRAHKEGTEVQSDTAQFCGCCKSISCNSFIAALEDPSPEPDILHPKSAKLKSNFYFSS